MYIYNTYFIREYLKFLFKCEIYETIHFRLFFVELSIFIKDLHQKYTCMCECFIFPKGLELLALLSNSTLLPSCFQTWINHFIFNMQTLIVIFVINYTPNIISFADRVTLLLCVLLNQVKTLSHSVFTWLHSAK